MTAVKICGFQSAADIAGLQSLPVDWAGFILAPSKRQITVKTLCKLSQLLPASIIPVAVLVNPSVHEVDQIVNETGVKALQLHGEEPPDWCEDVRMRYKDDLHLIKALPARGQETGDAIRRYGQVADTLLIDTYQPSQRGGTGKTFQWTDIPYYLEYAHHQGCPLWVAGGLTPHNVTDLLAQYNPDGVDVSSGVEVDGAKSTAYMKQFVERVKAV